MLFSKNNTNFDADTPQKSWWQKTQDYVNDFMHKPILSFGKKSETSVASPLDSLALHDSSDVDLSKKILEQGSAPKSQEEMRKEFIQGAPVAAPVSNKTSTIFALDKAFGQMHIAQGIFIGSLVLLAVSFFTNQILLSEGNYILGLFGRDNIQTSYARLTSDLAAKEKAYSEMSRLRDDLLSQDSSDSAVMISDIKSQEVLWTEILRQINEVITKISPYNSLTHKINVEQMTFDTEKREVNLGGTIANEAANQVFTLLANTVDAFEESPYFQGVEYDKYDVKEEDVGSYTAQLKLAFQLQGTLDPAEKANYAETNYSKRQYRLDGKRRYQTETKLEEDEAQSEEIDTEKEDSDKSTEEEKNDTIIDSVIDSGEDNTEKTPAVDDGTTAPVESPAPAKETKAASATLTDPTK